MATNRSRRLRKKLCVDEFQELGFELNLDFKQELDDKAIDAFLDAFLKEAMEANGLGYVGGDDFGLVCLSKRGSVSEEQRAAVEAWLKGRSELTEVTVSPRGSRPVPAPFRFYASFATPSAVLFSLLFVLCQPDAALSAVALSVPSQARSSPGSALHGRPSVASLTLPARMRVQGHHRPD